MRTETLTAVHLPAHGIRVLRDVLDEHGFDSGAAFSESAIDRHYVDDPHSKVAGSQVVAFQRAFVRQTADRPELWTRAGVRHTFQLLDVIGLAFWTAPDLDAWCRVLELSDFFHYGLTSHRILRDDAGRPFGVESAYNGDAELRDFYLVIDTAGLIRGMDAAWGGAFPFERIEYPVAMVPSLIKRQRAPAIATHGLPRLFWSPSIASVRLPGGDQALHESYLSVVHAEVRTLRESVAPELRVQQLLELPGNCSLPIEDAANALGTSVRTLQRRLGEHDVSYRDVQSAARRTAAARFIDETHLPIAQVAEALGYTNASSFSRAFSTWFDETPSERRRHRRR